jgi:hypothetical protein
MHFIYQACMQIYFAKTGSFTGQKVEFRLLYTATIKQQLFTHLWVTKHV